MTVCWDARCLAIVARYDWPYGTLIIHQSETSRSAYRKGVAASCLLSR